jgi:glutaminase
VDYSNILQQIHDAVSPTVGRGEVASYIPQLAKVNPNQFGMAVVRLNGDTYTTGDATQRFSIQSISKLFALVMALQRQGDALWDRVGREASGNPFNSLVQLEHEAGRPRNPFINAGALVVTDILCSHYVVPENAVVEFIRQMSGSPGVNYDLQVARSERMTSERNAAMAYFMRSFGNLQNSVEDVLNAYCRQCAIEMNCQELASAAAFLANGGTSPWDGRQVISSSTAKRLSALMLTCGTYDAAGDFAFRVGLPAKSGVGGGIVAIVPGECGVCVWSPALEQSGNSYAGSLALELMTTLTGRSIF